MWSSPGKAGEIGENTGKRWRNTRKKWRASIADSFLENQFLRAAGLLLVLSGSLLIVFYGLEIVLHKDEKGYEKILYIGVRMAIVGMVIGTVAEVISVE